MAVRPGEIIKTIVEAGRALGWREKCLLLVGAFFITFISEGLDVYGRASAEQAISGQLSSTFNEPLERALSGEGPRSPSLTTVLLIDRDSANNMGAPEGFDTPFLPYDIQAGYVEALVRAQPKAIFLDLTYSRDMSDPAGLAQLIAALRTARDANIPVFTGPIKPTPAFDSLRGLVTEVSVSWTPETPLDYPAYGYGHSYSAETYETNLTAAFSIYKYLCTQGDPICRAGRDFTPSSWKETVRPSDKVPPTLYPVWRPYVRSDTAPALYDSTSACYNAPKSNVEAFLRLFATQLFYRHSVRQALLERKCVAVPNFPIQTLVSAKIGSAVFLNDDLRQTHIADKIVMVGDNLGNDVFDVPMHGQISGVFHHAVALNNLIEDADAYRRWPNGIRIEAIGFSVPFSFFIEWCAAALVLCLMLVVKTQLTQNNAQQIVSSSAYFGLFLGLALASLVIGLLTSILVSRVFHWPAGDSFGILTFAALLFSAFDLERLVQPLVSSRWYVYWAAMIAGLVLPFGTYMLMINFVW